MNSSIIFYPNRGHGPSAIGGNCSGFVQKSLIDFQTFYFVIRLRVGGLPGTLPADGD